MVFAVWNDATIAASDKTVIVDGNHYFPPEAVDHTRLEESDRSAIRRSRSHHEQDPKSKRAPECCSDLDGVQKKSRGPVSQGRLQTGPEYEKPQEQGAGYGADDCSRCCIGSGLFDRDERPKEEPKHDERAGPVFDELAHWSHSPNFTCSCPECRSG